MNWWQNIWLKLRLLWRHPKPLEQEIAFPHPVPHEKTEAEKRRDYAMYCEEQREKVLAYIDYFASFSPTVVESHRVQIQALVFAWEPEDVTILETAAMTMDEVVNHLEALIPRLELQLARQQKLNRILHA